MRNLLAHPGLALLGIAFLAVFLYSAWWCYRSWPQIWSAPRTTFDILVYRYGVRGWGMAMWIAMSIVLPAYKGFRSGDVGMALGVRMIVGAIVMFPLYLWAGYWWGRGMAFLGGVNDDRPYAAADERSRG